jgi:ABC-type antimicrobial peptide transport system permease subunit
MPASPGGILPRDMDSRQWNTFLTQSGIQADRTVKAFTPTWSGFSADPTEDLNYYDFGTIVIIYNPSGSAILGTSDATTMEITNLPQSIQPTGIRKGHVLVTDNGGGEIFDGLYFISGATVTFGIATTSAVANRVVYTNTGFTAASDKGLAGGFILIYAK